MKPEAITSPLARVAMVLLCAMWTAAGWYLVEVQTFSTRSIRSPVVTVVDGPGAVFMGGVILLLGWMCLLLPWRILTQWL